MQRWVRVDAAPIYEAPCVSAVEFTCHNLVLQSTAILNGSSGSRVSAGSFIWQGSALMRNNDCTALSVLQLRDMCYFSIFPAYIFAFHGPPMGLPWNTQGRPTDYPRLAEGPAVVPWVAHGRVMGYPWVAYGVVSRSHGWPTGDP